MKTRILFINSPLTPKGARYSRSIAFGQLSIASCIPHESADVRLENYSTLGFQKFKNILNQYSPDIVGITLYENLLAETTGLISNIKSADSDIITCIGGPMATLSPSDSLTITGADFLFTGEAEKTFPDNIDYLLSKETNRDNSLAPYGVASADGHSLDSNPHDSISGTKIPMLKSAELDSIDLKWNYCSHLIHDNFIHFSTSRGCPNKCIFCAKYIPPVFRAMSPGKIKSELDKLCGYERTGEIPGIRFLSFDDDNFALKRDRVIELAAIMDTAPHFEISIQSNVKDFYIQGRIDRELITALKKLNVTQVSLGTESLCNSELDKLGKSGYRVKDVFRLVNALTSNNIRSNHYLLLSHYETGMNDVMISTFIISKMMIGNKLTGCYINPFVSPIYGSKYYDKLSGISDPYLEGQREPAFTHDSKSAALVLYRTIRPKSEFLSRALTEATMRAGKHNPFRNPTIPLLYFSSIGRNLKRKLKRIFSTSHRTENTSGVEIEIERTKYLLQKWKLLNRRLDRLKKESGN